MSGRIEQTSGRHLTVAAHATCQSTTCILEQLIEFRVGRVRSGKYIQNVVHELHETVQSVFTDPQAIVVYNLSLVVRAKVAFYPDRKAAWIVAEQGEVQDLEAVLLVCPLWQYPSVITQGRGPFSYRETIAVCAEKFAYRDEFVGIVMVTFHRMPEVKES